MAKKFTFPHWLIGSPEEQKAEADRQALALAAHGRGHLSEAERLLGRGVSLEATARGNMAQPNVLASSQYADALAMQGKYALAAEIHPDRARREHFENIVRAIEMPDEEKCPCSDSTTTVNGIDLALSPRFEVAKIFSPVHGGVVSLVRCSKCGHTNARLLQSRLLRQNAARNQSEQAGHAMASDIAVLATQG